MFPLLVTQFGGPALLVISLFATQSHAAVSQAAHPRDVIAEITAVGIDPERYPDALGLICEALSDEHTRLPENTPATAELATGCGTPYQDGLSQPQPFRPFDEKSATLL